MSRTPGREPTRTPGTKSGVPPPLIHTGALLNTPRPGIETGATDSGCPEVDHVRALPDRPGSQDRNPAAAGSPCPSPSACTSLGLTAFAFASYWNVGPVPEPQIADVFMLTLPPPLSGGGQRPRRPAAGARSAGAAPAPQQTVQPDD